MQKDTDMADVLRSIKKGRKFLWRSEDQLLWSFLLGRGIQAIDVPNVGTEEDIGHEFLMRMMPTIVRKIPHIEDPSCLIVGIVDLLEVM